MKKRFYLPAIFLGILFITYLLLQNKNPKTLESITYFPIHPAVTYKTYETLLQPAGQTAVLWKIESLLDRKAYLRQDAGLLFANGRLIGKQYQWKQNTAALQQEKRVAYHDNALLQAITFHHSELHEDSRIYSAQTESANSIYLLKQTGSTFSFFQKPRTQAQQAWKQKLDEQTDRTLRYSWNKGIRHFQIHLDQYQAYSLQNFMDKAKSGLPGMTREKSDQIIGQLWEGLYKNYLLGIKMPNGSIADPNGSTLPLILLANNHTHLLVLSETENGDPILLRQMIADGE